MAGFLPLLVASAILASRSGVGVIGAFGSPPMPIIGIPAVAPVASGAPVAPVATGLFPAGVAVSLGLTNGTRGDADARGLAGASGEATASVGALAGADGEAVVP